MSKFKSLASEITTHFLSQKTIWRLIFLSMLIAVAYLSTNGSLVKLNHYIQSLAIASEQRTHAGKYMSASTKTTHLALEVAATANVADGFLQNKYFQSASTFQNVGLNLVCVVCALVGFLFLRPLWALAFTLLLGTVLFLVTLFFISQHDTMFQPAAGLLGLLLTTLLWGWHRLDTVTRFLAEEFESFQQLQIIPFFPKNKSLTSDLLDHRIAALKEATGQLKISHRFVKDAVNSTPFPTLFANMEGEVQTANIAAAYHFRVRKPEILLGRNLTSLMADAISKTDNQPFLHNQSVFACPVEIVDEVCDCAGRELRVKCIPVLSTGRIGGGWILSIIDVTSMRKAERAQEETFHFISHDLKAPVSSIISAIALYKLDNKLTVEELTNRIEGYANNALCLTDDFINLSTAKNDDCHFELLNLADLLIEAADESWEFAKIHKININLPKYAADAYAQIDRQLFKRALRNLINNAIKYSPPNSTVSCSINDNGILWSIAIKDQGFGIAPEKMEHLFRPFSRLHVNDHPEIRGTGLGLAFINTVITNHRGTISVLSEVGKGSTFQISIPKISLLDTADSPQFLNN